MKKILVVEGNLKEENQSFSDYAEVFYYVRDFNVDILEDILM